MEILEGDDKANDLIQTAVLERLSMNTPTTGTKTVHTDSETPLTDDVVFIVCLVSLLMAFILVTLFSIFLICVWIIRLDKKKTRKVSLTEKV